MCFALFQSWLRFKINLGKLEMVPVGKVHEIEALAGVHGYKISSLPLKYLSPPFGELKSKADVGQIREYFCVVVVG